MVLGVYFYIAFSLLPYIPLLLSYIKADSATRVAKSQNLYDSVKSLLFADM